MRVPDPNLHKQYGRDAQIVDASLWVHEREIMVPVGSYSKFTQTQAMRQYVLDTGHWPLTKASLCDTIWGMSYRADHQNAQCPPAWRGLNLL